MPQESTIFDVTRFYKYDELTDLLKQFVEKYPNLASLESAGQSYEGRDIWAMTITNRETGNPADKPAVYIDGNIHAGEVTGCNVCLYTIDYLLANFETDTEVKFLLDTSTFYVLPRVGPDGAERYLTTPEMLRSSVRPYPTEEEDYGLTPKDIDGDGLILQMRIPDPNGEWKISQQDNRLMVKRRPDELEGDFYRLYTEGELRDAGSGPVKLARPLFGLDQNRNWPANWSATQRGGGSYPLSEPETQAVARFVDSHRNIVVLQNYHTTGGVVLRSPCAKSDTEFPQRDIQVYKTIGEIGEELTGYPCSTVYDAFPTLDDQGRRSTAGGFIEWTYEHRGIISFATELWDIKSRAGIDRPKNDPMRTVVEETEEDGLKLLAWNDEHLGGRGFEKWRSFEHPQLGQVEIGGWKTKEVRQNAPAEFLEDECHRNMLFSLRHAAMLPRLKVGKVEVESLGDDLHILRITVQNAGFLPTNGTDMALRTASVDPIRVEVEGAEVLIGRPKIDIGQLQGRAAASGPMFRYGQARVENERLVELLVRGNDTLTVTIHSDRAGTVQEVVQLAL